MNNSYFIYTSVLMPAADKVAVSDLLGKENSVMNLRGNTYLCSAKYIEDLGGTVYLLSPYENIETTAKRWAFFFESLSFIFVAALLVWLCFIQKKTKDEVLSEEKRRQYNPSRVRFLIGIYALFGVLLIFATTYFVQMMNSLYTQTKQGDQILDVLISTTAQEKTQIQTNTNEEVENIRYVSILDAAEDGSKVTIYGTEEGDGVNVTMTGGDNITETTLKSAEELIDSYEQR